MADQPQLFENKKKPQMIVVEIRGLCTVYRLEIRNIEYPDERLVLSDYADAEGSMFLIVALGRARRGGKENDSFGAVLWG